jgi:hypothetical protein
MDEIRSTRGPQPIHRRSTWASTGSPQKAAHGPGRRAGRRGPGSARSPARRLSARGIPVPRIARVSPMGSEAGASSPHYLRETLPSPRCWRVLGQVRAEQIGPGPPVAETGQDAAQARRPLRARARVFRPATGPSAPAGANGADSGRRDDRRLRAGSELRPGFRPACPPMLQSARPSERPDGEGRHALSRHIPRMPTRCGLAGFAPARLARGPSRPAHAHCRLMAPEGLGPIRRDQLRCRYGTGPARPHRS